MKLKTREKTHSDRPKYLWATNIQSVHQSNSYRIAWHSLWCVTRENSKNSNQKRKKKNNNKKKIKKNFFYIELIVINTNKKSVIKVYKKRKKKKEAYKHLNDEVRYLIQVTDFNSTQHLVKLI